jgi:hypothetical protein
MKVKTPAELLAEIERHLNSVRNMLTFFTVVLVLMIMLQGCALLLSF